jgi:hypothetical protein
MKIMLNGKIMDIDFGVDAMRQALIDNEVEQLKNIGCDGNEADEMAHDIILPLSNEEIIERIKPMEIL